METLFTPWRYEYITASPDPDAGCFLCLAARSPDDPERLVVHTAERHIVLLNRHPYSNGHLMVAPHDHVADPRDADAQTRAELWPLVLRCQEVLDGVYRVDGFNLGMNLGRSAGAGTPDHYHFHVVPRWRGDTNFMSVVGSTRLVPESLDETRETLRGRFSQKEPR